MLGIKGYINQVETKELTLMTIRINRYRDPMLSMVQHKAELSKHSRSEGRLFQNEYTVSTELDLVQ